MYKIPGYDVEAGVCVDNDRSSMSVKTITFSRLWAQ